MTTSPRILRLYLLGNWPRLESACPWAVLTRAGEVVARGIGESGSWPPADELEAVLSADQVSWLSINLPEKMGRDASRIIAYALEEKLLEPPEAMHFVVPRPVGSAEKSAIVTRRLRLQEIVEAVAACGRRLDRLYTEMQLAPSAAGEWTLCRCGESAFLRFGAELGLATDWPGEAPPDALRLALGRARARDGLPQRVVVRVSPGQKAAIDTWAAALEVPVVAGASFDPLVAPSGGASNLLTGSFAPKGRTGPGGRSVRLSVMALLGAGMVHTLASLGDWSWLAYQVSVLRTEAIAIYREAVPDSKVPLLDAGLQLHREAGRVLHQRGKTGRADMLVMLAALSRELPPDVRPRRLSFDPSALEIIAVLQGDSLQRLGPALRLHGYGIDATVVRQDAAGTEYKIRMRLL